MIYGNDHDYRKYAFSLMQQNVNTFRLDLNIFNCIYHEIYIYTNKYDRTQPVRNFVNNNFFYFFGNFFLNLQALRSRGILKILLKIAEVFSSKEKYVDSACFQFQKIWNSINPINTTRDFVRLVYKNDEMLITLMFSPIKLIPI